MIFNYNPQQMFANSLEVDDIGNTAIRCTNDEFEDYFIVTQTSLGKTYILKFGPICQELEEPLDYFSLDYKKIDYKEKAIASEITKFMTDFRKRITQAEVVELKTALDAYPDVYTFIS